MFDTGNCIRHAVLDLYANKLKYFWLRIGFQDPVKITNVEWFTTILNVWYVRVHVDSTKVPIDVDAVLTEFVRKPFVLAEGWILRCSQGHWNRIMYLNFDERKATFGMFYGEEINWENFG